MGFVLMQPAGTFEVVRAVDRAWNKSHVSSTVGSKACFRTVRWCVPSCCGTPNCDDDPLFGADSTRSVLIS